MITQKELLALVTYNAETGVFTSNNRRGRVSKGAKCGAANNEGYVRIELAGKSYSAHRLAFLYVTGSIPDVVDHINGDTQDNRFANLREATLYENARNSRKKISSSFRFKGVQKHGKKFFARINTGSRKTVKSPLFNSEIEAAYHYDILSIEHHGLFGRRNFLPLM